MAVDNYASCPPKPTYLRSKLSNCRNSSGVRPESLAELTSRNACLCVSTCCAPASDNDNRTTRWSFGDVVRRTNPSRSIRWINFVICARLIFNALAASPCWMPGFFQISQRTVNSPGRTCSEIFAKKCSNDFTFAIRSKNPNDASRSLRSIELVGNDGSAWFWVMGKTKGTNLGCPANVAPRCSA